MPSLETLDDGQRALLQLLLKQGKSYDDLAALLKSDPTGVRKRAHDAVEALGPVTAGIGRERRNEVADYLLGQQTASQRAATREFLEGSAAGRTWARATSGVLRPMAPNGLPEVPAEPEEVEEAFDALDKRTARQEEVKRSSRTGGMLLFAGLGLVLAIGLLWALGAFDSKDAKQKTTASTSTVATTETPTTFEPLQTAVMKPAKGSTSKTEAVAVIARPVGSEDLSLAIRAVDVPESSKSAWAYGIWLYSSPTTAQFVGFPKLVGKDGLLEAAFQLPKDTVNYKAVLLTRETVEKPKQPGALVLSGPLTKVPPSARGQGTTTTPPSPSSPGAKTTTTP